MYITDRMAVGSKNKINLHLEINCKESNFVDNFTMISFCKRGRYV